MTQKRLTKSWLRNHVSYSWWKYLMVVCFSVLGVNLLFTVTEYRVPEDKKIEVYMLNGFAQAQQLQDELFPLFLAQCPDQEELTVANINLTGSDIYAYMQFSTYIAAKQGDVCVIPKGEILKLAADGAEHAFVELTPYIESGVINPKGIDLSAGMFKNEAGEMGLYAIPADTLYGLVDYGNDPAGGYLAMFAHGGNDEHAAAVVNLMIEQFHSEKPEEYDELHRSIQNQSTFF